MGNDKDQIKIYTSIPDIKSILETMNSRLNDTEEHIFDLENRIVEITQSEQQRERQMKKKKKMKTAYKISGVR